MVKQDAFLFIVEEIPVQSKLIAYMILDVNYGILDSDITSNSYLDAEKLRL